MYQLNQHFHPSDHNTQPPPPLLHIKETKTLLLKHLVYTHVHRRSYYPARPAKLS